MQRTQTQSQSRMYKQIDRMKCMYIWYKHQTISHLLKPFFKIRKFYALPVNHMKILQVNFGISQSKICCMKIMSNLCVRRMVI